MQAYAFDWTPDRIEWIIDGVTVATLTNATAGSGYPQIPGRVTFGVWCPACYGDIPGLVGTQVDNKLGIYTATIRTLDIINYNPATYYTYHDMSGLSSSVVIHHESSGLTRGEIAGIVIAALVGIVLIISVLVWLRGRKTTGRSLTEGEPLQNLSGVIKGPEIVDDNQMPEDLPLAHLRYHEDLKHLRRSDAEFHSRSRSDRSSETPLGGRLGTVSVTRAGGRLGSQLY